MDDPVTTAAATIKGVKHIRLAAAALRQVVARIEADLEAGDGLDTADGWNVNDVPLLMDVIADLEGRNADGK